MAKKVGIPRGLFYYKYFPLWKTFFEELGVEIVLSEHTSKRILDRGVESCIDDACLPVKIFHGHVDSIKDKVDYIFIPRYTSISKNEYVCPKFGGLPDMVRNTLKDLPVIIDTEVNMRKSRNNSIKAAYKVGSFFENNRNKIKHAIYKALSQYREYKERIETGCFPDEITHIRKVNTVKDNEKLNILIIGHVYNLYDHYVNMGMLNKLAENGVNILTCDMIDNEIINDKVKILPKRVFWNFGRKAVGSALFALENQEINGIIYVMSFGCGVDSFMSDLVERKLRENKGIPFITITLDEHSGEAGMDTRLEAFIDMIRWRT